MASGTGPEAAGWGISYGLFGSDSAADPDESEPPPRSRSTRQKPSRSASSSFGRATSTQGRGAPRARSRRGSAGRASFDDPFAPVVGASADADEVSEAAEAPGTGGGDGSRRGARGGDRSPSAGARGGNRAAAAGRTGGTTGDTGDTAPDGDDAPVRSDEQWTSLARSVLLRQLSLGARSRHQLDRKLAEREVPPPIAAALLDRFEEVQLIDDAEFARMWVRTRTAAKSLSRSSLRRELADKGIDAELAEDALLQLSDEDEDGQAREVVRRKLRRSADLSDRAVREKEVRRLVGVLARKGYSPGTAFSIVKGVIAEAE
ncbi:regulatory protein RecX [Arthrobacter antioxidans]|uniref:regulatory protein RecX n=1 Tax=Arthrobacter antioxidans TaxID=2895818 RepID=UPI001FFFC226|nr:regulatory protein RecX [Arthrobacter antioxidans]